jgi:hypothetical protein
VQSKKKAQVESQTVPSASGSLDAAKVEEKKEVEHLCRDCRFYNKSKEKPMDRGKIRKGLIETRAPCENKDSSAFHHRVKDTSKNKECFEEGVFVSEKKKKPKKEESTPEVKKQHVKTETVKNPLNDKRQVLETHNNGKVYVQK